MTDLESMNEKNELVNVAMKIILHAGDARQDCQKALNSIGALDFDKAAEHMKSAHENIRRAHASQTEIIQNEAKGKVYQYSLLFTHAQDTIMTINSEVILIDGMIAVFRQLAVNGNLNRKQE